MDATFLIAAPQMDDPLFARTVVLVWKFDEEGAVGVIVNRPVSAARERGVFPGDQPMKLPDVLNLDADVLAPYADEEVHWGGPVDLESGTVLAQAVVEGPEGLALPDGMTLTHSIDAFQQLLADEVPLLLCLGYAGWGPGQLENEMETGGWLIADVSAKLLFETPAAELWESAIKSLNLTSDDIWLLSPPVSE